MKNTDRIKELKERLKDSPNIILEGYRKTELQAREECQEEIDRLKERIELLKEQIWNYETLDNCTVVADKGEFKALEKEK